MMKWTLSRERRGLFCFTGKFAAYTIKRFSKEKVYFSQVLYFIYINAILLMSIIKLYKVKVGKIEE